MPTISMKAFEESRRHQLVTEHQVSPMQSAEQTDYQIKIDGIPSSFKEDARIILKGMLDYWVESQGSAWSKLPRLPIGTSKLLYSLAGNPSAKPASNGRNTFENFDDFGDGNYTNAPVWTVQTGSWSASNFYLEKTTTDAWEFITTPSSAAVGRWAWSVKHGAVASANDLAFFPITDTPSGTNGNQINIYVAWNNNIYITLHTGGTSRWQDAVTWTSDTNWHDFVFTKDSNHVMKLYKDGVQIWTRTESTYLLTSSTYMKVQIYKSASRFDNLRLGKYVTPEPIAQKLRTLNRALLIKNLGRAG